MILCDRDLHKLVFPEKYSVTHPPPLLSPCEESLINPASVDIRVGNSRIRESEIMYFNGQRDTGWEPFSLESFTQSYPLQINPGQVILLSTLETINVPNGYAIDLRLKSSVARAGWNHALAFWFDPGWSGVGTMELQNITRYQTLTLWSGMRIAQVIVHRLSGPADKPYAGRYQGAMSVEGAK